jgi:dienelactone hydrolase
VDTGRLCAIGFCFGGSVVLELARDGADLKAVASFHGVLAAKAPALPGKVKASVLVLTGGNDPLAPPEHVVALENEMRVAGVRDWQVVTYGTPTLPSPILQQMVLSFQARFTMSNRTVDRGQQ